MNTDESPCLIPSLTNSPEESKTPLSANERRYRNRLASAKYRARKQKDTKSMMNRATQLMDMNYQLSKDLVQAKQENEKLRAMYEKVILHRSNYRLPPLLNQ
ncbi:hypothetical protein BY458DRAFT_521794 [Sporodiniella umbellata]|nr:hypothetical protein BY458DRAFT_521794 [Sporodiniella umbellata]